MPYSEALRGGGVLYSEALTRGGWVPSSEALTREVLYSKALTGIGGRARAL